MGTWVVLVPENSPGETELDCDPNKKLSVFLVSDAIATDGEMQTSVLNRVEPATQVP